jgi:hypothetical protein
MHVSKIRCDGESEKFCKIFLKLNRPSSHPLSKSLLLRQPDFLDKVKTKMGELSSEKKSACLRLVLKTRCSHRGPSQLGDRSCVPR